MYIDAEWCDIMFRKNYFYLAECFSSTHEYLKLGDGKTLYIFKLKTT